MRFVFVHMDGRDGEGWSVWAAIVQAMGVVESRALPELRDPRWIYPDDWPEYSDGKRGPTTLHRHAEVLTEAEEKLGDVFEID
jgi:hypothetical protein